MGLTFVAAVACATVILGALWLKALPRSRRIFLFAMLLLAMEALATYPAHHGFHFWSQETWILLRVALLALVPFCWLIFILIFANGQWERSRKAWAAAGFSGAFISLAAFLFLREVILGEVFYIIQGTVWRMEVTKPGLLVFIPALLTSIMVIVFAESKLRATRGHQRWQAKFMLLGLTILFATRVFTLSQTILYRTLDPALWTLDLGVTLLAAAMIFVSIYRTRNTAIRIQLSPTAHRYSVSLVLIGAYLLVVGMLATLIHQLEWMLPFPAMSIFLLVALTFLAIGFFSDRLRLRVKRFASRHLSKSGHDYRSVWNEFNNRTLSLTDRKALCQKSCAYLAETFDCLSATIWLRSSHERGGLYPAGTTFTPLMDCRLGESQKGGIGTVFDRLKRERTEHLIDLEDESPEGDPFQELQDLHVRFCLPLWAGSELIGLLTLDDRVQNTPLSDEDVELLETMADQISAKIYSLELFEQIQEAQDLKTFQMVSAFLVHDLKNVAGSLNLLLQNLPKHFDNPQFREDALSLISQNSSKITHLCDQLRTSRQAVLSRKTPSDLNELVRQTVNSLNGTLKGHLSLEQESLPPVEVDSEEVQKVFLNLLLNASDAIDDQGTILVKTHRNGNDVVVSVADNGCGMEEGFLRRELFKPFKTTKEKGLGIGLFQCKSIVEAHGGTMEVQSEPGRGTEFRVRLPLKAKNS